MSICDKYQGFSNRETWLVAIWIANEQDAHEYWEVRTWEMVKRGNRDGVATLARELQEWCKERQPELPTGMFSDLTNAAMERVDWVGIVESHWRDCECDHYDPKHRSFSTRRGDHSGTVDRCDNVGEGGRFQNPRRDHQTSLDGMRQSAIRRNGPQSELLFTVSVITGKGTASDIELKSVCGPGDGGEPVLTIMMPVEG